MLLSKNRVIRRRAVVGLLILAALSLLSLSYRQGSSGVVGDIQRGTSSATAPLTSAAHRVTQPFVDAWNWGQGLIDARNQDAQLKRLQSQYSALLIQYRTESQGVGQLKQALHFVQHNAVAKSYPFVTTTVIQQPTDVYNGSVVIDAGSSSGISVDDPVVAPAADGGGGLIGVITSCGASTCNARLITDQANGSAVTAKVLGSTAQGSLEPSSGDPGLLSLTLVPNSIPLRNGYTVVTSGIVTGGGGTSGLQSLLPAGIPIGRISSVQTTDYSSGGFHFIQVTPFVDFTNLSTVMVLKVPHHG
jgi:rod shape-determining protein MreC